MPSIGASTPPSRGEERASKTEIRESREHGPATRVTLSEEAKTASKRQENPEELTPEEEKQVEELRARDAEVRTHEQAHVAAGGPYIKGGIHYDYQRGPDNKQYAVGGHVEIDTSPIPDDPEATIRKAQVVRRAALAPAEPSGADRKVAAKAAQMAQKARAELAAETQSPLEEDEASAQDDDDSGLSSASAPPSFALKRYAQALA